MTGMMNSAPASKPPMLSGRPPLTTISCRTSAQAVTFRAPRPPAGSLNGRTDFQHVIGAAPIGQINLAELSPTTRSWSSPGSVTERPDVGGDGVEIRLRKDDIPFTGALARIRVSNVKHIEPHCESMF